MKMRQRSCSYGFQGRASACSRPAAVAITLALGLWPTPVDAITVYTRPAGSSTAATDLIAPDQATAGTNVVYSNTGANLLFPPGANRRIADDLFTTELCGCRLTQYELTIGGGGDGTGPGFSATIGLYDGCPNEGGVLIPGTATSISFLDDGLHTVVVDVSQDAIQIPNNVWLAVEFDVGGAGWLVGAAPETGFSDDVYDHPNFPCVAGFTGSLYASFAASITCALPGPPTLQNPIPADGATGVNTNVVLAWNGGAPLLRGATSPEREGELVTPENFVSGFEHPDVFLQQMKDAIARGEVPDPATVELPEVAPRTRFGPADNNLGGFVVPTVTPSDIFPFEDSADLIASTNFSSGALFGLMAMATNEVLAAHGDNFDFVAFFINFVPNHQIGAAFYLGIENDVSGIGLNTFNNRPAFGIAGDNVEGWVMMWRESDWSEGYFTFTQLVMGQEFEHRFGMFLNPLPGGRPMQGDNGACGRGSHWNFRVDGQGSGMEIAEWTGTGTLFRQGGTLNFNADIDGGVFSYPDLYLMGYVSGPEMDSGASELRYLDDNTNCSSPYSGAVSTWSSQDIVATNGTRNPTFLQAQKHFNTAWVMIHRPVAVGGHLPTSNELNHVVGILNTWNDVWIASTLNKGTMTNVLEPPPGPLTCTTTYDVLLDTLNPPIATACTQVTQPTCDPGGLTDNQTYFWQVLATNDLGTTQGPVWTFSTSNAGADCNGNGIPDDVDIAQGTSSDCNGNQIPDECEPDSDGDGVPDACDPCPLDNPDDTDGDGVCDSADVCPGGNDTIDTDADGVPDACDPCPLDNPDDTDGDGVCDSADICPGGNDSQDTDADGVPDFCDPCPLDNPDDADGDGVCTSEDNCPLPNPGQLDCQPNGIGDVCDVDAGTSLDANANGIPDECEASPPAPPLAEDGLLGSCVLDSDCLNEASCIGNACYIPKNRYISVTANPLNAGVLTARRIRLVDGATPVPLGWIGFPTAHVLNGPEANPVLVARIVDLPAFAVWSQDAALTLHVGDCAVSPGHRYQVQSIKENQDLGLEANYSAPLELPTVAAWGDVVGPDSSPPDGGRNLIDVQAIVFGFLAQQTVAMVRLDLEGDGIPTNIPDVTAVNLADVLRAVQGFQGNAYPFSAPLDCP
ncbi:MAG: hypothetical protein ACE5E5_07675 [Phycisphaerae bacterium]